MAKRQPITVVGYLIKPECVNKDVRDLKKSDVYQSGILTGTAPSYDSYIELKRKFESSIIPIKE